jgi:hypothetical protein
MQPSAQVALYKECVTKAANDGSVLMETLVDRTRLALQAKASSELDTVERQLLGQAVQQLDLHERTLRERFPLTLMTAFSEALESDRTPKAKVLGGASAALRFDQLELMDESQVQENIELARAQQTALAVADLQLAELNSLMCAVMGLKTVQPDRNPLRPEVYVKALRTVLTLTGADGAIRLRWMQFMGVALGERLKTAYLDLSRLLESRGVRPVGYVVTQTQQAGNPQRGRGAGHPGAPGAASGGYGGPMGYGASRGAPAGGGAAGGVAGGSANGGGAGTGGGGRVYGQEALLTVDQLRRLLAGELDSMRQGLASAASGLSSSAGARAGGGSTAGGVRGEAPGRPARGPSGVGGSTDGAGEIEPPPPDFDNTVPAAFEALEEMRQVDKVLKRLTDRQNTRAGTTGLTPLGGGVETTLDLLRRDAKGTGQALSLEVVNLMFENIALDPNLLPPVQSVLRRVEPAYLRLALIDPRFFSDKQHVARRLLEQMTERSLAYATVVSPGFEAFLKSLREAAEVLAISQIRDVEPFERALKTLQRDWDEQARRENRQRDKAMHALLHAEQRNLLAEKMAAEVKLKPGAGLAPTDVMEFLTGPWSQVLAEARLADRKGAPDPGGYMALVNDMIWTTQPEQTRVNLDRIRSVLPELLQKIREGLALIDYPKPQIDAFVAYLLGLYDRLMQVGNSVQSEVARARERRAGGRPSQASGPDTNDPWLAPTEMQDTGFLDIPEAEPQMPGFRETESLFESTAPDLDPTEADKRAADRSKPPIPPGAWVELRLHDQVLRAQLTWSSPYGTLFMFTDATGATHSLTRRALDKLLARGSVTLISQGVVEGALDAVADTALRNSVDLKL